MVRSTENIVTNSQILTNPPQNMQNVFLGLKYLCKFSYLTGSFPVRGGFKTGKLFMDFTAKKFSWSFFFSCTIGVFIKLCCAAFVPEPVALSTKDRTRFNETNSTSVTDLLTTNAGFILLNTFGIITHFLVTLRTAKFLKVATLLEEYATRHPTPKAKLFNSWTIGELLCSLFSLTYLTFWAYFCYSELRETVEFLSLLLIGGYQPAPWGYAVIYLTALILLEYSIWFVHMQIFFPTNLISEFLSDLIHEITERSRNYSAEPTFESNKTIKSKSKGRIKSISWTILNVANDDTFWVTLSSRYIQIENIVLAFESFVGPCITISLAFAVGSSVCMIYIATLSDLVWSSRILRTCVIQGTCFTAAFRVFAITSVGEMLKEKYAQLRKEIAIARDRSLSNFSIVEPREVCN
ncbi:hypothetical protein Fcan01_01439 [Folsomia candida]|uniref:Uncharacterized protein n=1 Tax=Folsomia candida TaxID=158441 RepID=A0A226EY75_FOLCA|nr:hypothetical protein Fcan01_01439 [Folsomia candida]